MTDKMTAEQALEWLVSQAECLAENCGSSFAKIEEARQALTAPRVPDGVTVFPTTLDETDAWHSMSKTGERPVEGCDSVERWNLCNLTSDCIGGGIEIWWKQASIAALRIVVRDDFNRSRAVQVLTAAPAPADNNILERIKALEDLEGDMLQERMRPEKHTGETDHLGAAVTMIRLKIRSLKDKVAAPAPADVNYVDAFNGDVPMPAPGQSLVDALRERLESSDVSPEEIKQRVDLRLENIRLRERANSVGAHALEAWAVKLRKEAEGTILARDTLNVIADLTMAEAARLREGGGQ